MTSGQLLHERALDLPELWSLGLHGLKSVSHG